MNDTEKPDNGVGDSDSLERRLPRKPTRWEGTFRLLDQLYKYRATKERAGELFDRMYDLECALHNAEEEFYHHDIPNWRAEQLEVVISRAGRTLDALAADAAALAKGGG